MPQPADKRLVTEAAQIAQLNPVKSRLDKLDSAGQRGYKVDQSAGRVITVWDYLNSRDQMIYGDTGERDISALLTGATGTVKVQRTGNTVHLYLYGVSPTTSTGVFLNIPSGFRPVSQRNFQLNIASAGTSYRSAYLFSSGGLGVFLPATSDSYSISLTYPTANPWPTSLPGNA